MSDTLKKICNDKRRDTARRKKLHAEAKLMFLAKEASPVRGFISALENSVRIKKNALIAEIKKASPSKGVIREDFDPRELARAYEVGGAACLSVLTDEPYFEGKDEDLEQARGEVRIPVLRKDFMLDPYQIIESRTIGADCILLIVAALQKNQAQELEAAAMEFKMDVLVEIHNEWELETAMELKTRLIGINNRDLKTLKVDLKTSEKLAPRIPKEKLIVCESGISNHEDIKRMNKAGINIFLVGESLMKQDDVEGATRKLLGQ